MTKGTSEPTRWRDGADEWQELVQDLDARAGAGPAAGAEERVLSLLAQGEPTDTAVTGARASSGGGKLALLGLAVLLVGLGTLYLATRVPSAPDEKRERNTAHSQVTTPAETHEVPNGRVAPGVPAVPAEEPVQPVQTSKRRVLASSPAPVEPPIERASDVAAELALLSRARRVLLNDPTRSLELVAEHETTYPHGSFVEEREVIAVEALLRAGQSETGRARGAAFLRLHPNSAHGVRVRELLQGI